MATSSNAIILKTKTISQISIAFLKSTSNVAHSEKKDHLDSSNVGKVIDSKNCAYLNSKNLFFQNTLQSQRVHGSLTLPTSVRHHLYPKFPLIQDQLNRIKYLWIRSKILGLFVNTLTADYMYSAHSWKKIPQQVQTQIS